jgi:hypothetical protein
MKTEPATPRDIPTACVLLVGAAIAALGAGLRVAGELVEGFAVELVTKLGRI